MSHARRISNHTYHGKGSHTEAKELLHNLLKEMKITPVIDSLVTPQFQIKKQTINEVIRGFPSRKASLVLHYLSFQQLNAPVSMFCSDLDVIEPKPQT